MEDLQLKFQHQGSFDFLIVKSLTIKDCPVIVLPHVA